MTQHLVTIRQLHEWFNEPSKDLDRMVEVLDFPTLSSGRQKIKSLVMILAVNVGTAAWFFMPGLFTKTGSCWSRKGGDLIVQPSYPCRNVCA